MNFESASSVAAALFSLALGLFAVYKDARQAANRNFLFFSATLAIWNLSEIVSLVHSHAAQLILYRTCYVGGSFIATSFMMFLWAVMQIPPARIYAVVRYVSVFFAVIAGTPLLIRDIRIDNMQGIVEIQGPFYLLFIAYFLASLAYSLLPLFMNYGKWEGIRRTQARYISFAIVLGLVAIIDFVWNQTDSRVPPIHYLLQMGISATFAYSIARHRLMDITVIIRKTLTYSAATGILTTIYLVVIAIVAKFCESFTGFQTMFSTGLAAALVAIGFQPLRRRIQALVDARFFRDYVDREEKLYELSRDVITHTTPEAMAQALLRVLTETLHPKCGALYLRSRDGRGFTAASMWGPQPLPTRLSEDYALSNYFADHPQPFVHDAASEIASPKDTRRVPHKERG